MERNSSAVGPRPGWVYVLVNPAMPGLVKIGMTSRTPRERARELSRATGVPEPFAVAHAVAVSDRVAVEDSLHRDLTRSGLRVNGRREFFRLRVEEARGMVDRAAAAHRIRTTAAATLRRLAAAAAAALAAAALLAAPEPFGDLILAEPADLARWGAGALVVALVALAAFGGTGAQRPRRRRR